MARVPGYKERGLSLDRNDFIPKCMAWRLGLRLDQVPAVHRDPHSRSIFYPYFRIYNSQVRQTLSSSLANPWPTPQG